MSLRVRLERLESQRGTGDLMGALRAWVGSLPLDDVRVLVAFSDLDEPFSEERHGMTNAEAQRRADQLLLDAPEDILQAFLSPDAPGGDVG